jgi:ketosteroid isomerase-like protein
VDNVQLIKDVYAARARGDLGALTEALDPNVEWYEAEGSPAAPPGGERWLGSQVVLRNIARIAAQTGEMTVATPARFHDAGDTVVVEGRYSGGGGLDAQFCHLWTVANGRITRYQQYTDTAQIKAVMRPPG